MEEEEIKSWIERYGHLLGKGEVMTPEEAVAYCDKFFEKIRNG